MQVKTTIGFGSPNKAWLGPSGVWERRAGVLGLGLGALEAQTGGVPR